MRREGEVVIPIIAFLEGGVRLSMRPVMRDYLRHFRLAPVQCAVNVFRILGSVDALNEQIGLRLTHHDVNWCYNLQSGAWHDGLPCLTKVGHLSRKGSFFIFLFFYFLMLS